MKRLLSLTLILCLVFCSLLALVSCSQRIDSGTYKSGSSEIRIDGRKMYVSRSFNTEEGYEIAYRYKIIEDGKRISLSFRDIILHGESAPLISFAEDLRREKEGKRDTLDFEMGSSYIKLGGIKYTKSN